MRDLLTGVFFASLVSAVVAGFIWFPIATVLVLFFFCVPFAAYLFFLCGTFLEEGTGKLALKLKAFHKTLVAKQGYGVDQDENIVDTTHDPNFTQFAEYHPLGGWRWVGIWPIYRVFKKDTFRWAKMKPDDTLEDKEDRNVSRLLLRYYVYGIKSDDAEDKNLVPVNSLWSITAWTINLKNAWLDTEDWFGAFRGRIKPYIRHHVSLHTYQDIIAKDNVRLDKEVKDTLITEGIIDELRNRHGIHIIAIECVDISPDPSYREDTLKRWRAEREAEANLRRQEVEAKAFAAQTAGAELEMIASMSGIPAEDLQRAIQEGLEEAVSADPEHGLENWMKAHPKYWDLIQKKLLGVRPVLFGNADGSKLDPLTAAIASLISLAKGAGTGVVGPVTGFAGGGNQGTVQPSARRKKKPQDMTADELEEAWEEEEAGEK